MAVELSYSDWFNKLSDDQKKAVIGGDFGAYVLNEGLSHVAPIWWLTLDAERRAALRNGSAFIVDCGRGPFAVTAGHVFEEYRRAKNAAAQAGCQIGDVLFDPESRLIDCDMEIDVATFRVDASEAARIGSRAITAKPALWPPQAPIEGNFALFAGYPALSRGISPTGNYFAAVPYRAMTPISRITDRQITCRFDREKMVDLSGQGLPPIGYDIGGISGGPLLIPTLESRGVTWRLGGVVIQAAAGGLFEQVVAVRADFILPDGRLAHAC